MKIFLILAGMMIIAGTAWGGEYPIASCADGTNNPCEHPLIPSSTFESWTDFQTGKVHNRSSEFGDFYSCAPGWHSPSLPYISFKNEDIICLKDKVKKIKEDPVMEKLNKIIKMLEERKIFQDEMIEQRFLWANEKQEKIIKMLEGMQPKTQVDRMLPDFQQEKIPECIYQFDFTNKDRFPKEWWIMPEGHELCIARRK